MAGYETDAKSYLDAEKRFIRKTGAKHPGYFYNSAGVGQSDSYFFDTEAENCFMMRQNSGRFYRSDALIQHWYESLSEILAQGNDLPYYWNNGKLNSFHTDGLKAAYPKVWMC